MNRLFSCLSLFLFTSPLMATTSEINPTQLLKRTTDRLGCTSVNNKIYSDHRNLSLTRPQEALVLDEYGFQYLHEFSLHCQQQKMIIKIYRMLDTIAAYGIFTFYRTSQSKILQSFPVMAHQDPDWIAFAQSDFYVQVYQQVDSNSSKTLGLKIALYLSEVLPRDWELPSIVHHLPKNNKIPNSELFVMGSHALSQRYDLYLDDLFGLKHGAQAILADYKSSNKLVKVLIIIYPNQHLAKKHLKIGHQKFLNQNPQKKIFYKREGPLVIIVLDSNDPQFAISFLEQVSYVSSVTWDPKLQPVSVANMMLNVFTYVGAVVGVALLIGLLFGLLKALLTRLLPEKYLSYGTKYEIIQLNINKSPKKY